MSILPRDINRTMRYTTRIVDVGLTPVVIAEEDYDRVLLLIGSATGVTVQVFPDGDLGALVGLPISNTTGTMQINHRDFGLLTGVRWWAITEFNRFVRVVELFMPCKIEDVLREDVIREENAAPPRNSGNHRRHRRNTVRPLH